MTHPTWNMSGRTTGTIPLVGLTSRPTPAARLFLLLVLLGSSAQMRAGDEQPGPFLFTSTARTPKDIELEAKVRKALREDAQLRPLNLGVHVSGGVANLSGPVPTANLKRKALAIVQRVDGILTISAKDLYVSSADQGGKRSSVLVLDDRPTQTRSASPGSPIGGTGQQITLLAPETVAPAAPPRISSNVGESRAGGARLTANPHPPSPAAAISAAIEHLRRSKTRYQLIRTQVQGATVFVFPEGTASEDVMTFAQAIRRLPGVQHVIMAADPR
jgi:hypothetical protein